jgi:Domain of unknown function (DUF1843)
LLKEDIDSSSRVGQASSAVLSFSRRIIGPLSPEDKPGKRGISMPDIRPYGVAIQQAVASGDLQQMKSTLLTAEKHVAEYGDVSSAIEVLKIAIAKLEAHK